MRRRWVPLVSRHGLPPYNPCMPKLGVNVDHVATIRQARKTDEPDPVWAAVEAELGGADGITFHLREDRRHIQDRDAQALRQTVGVKLNMEMAIAEEIVIFAEALAPDQCTLVPERREELTTEGGLDVVAHRRRIGEVVKQLKKRGMVLSAFVEPLDDQIRASADAGFDAIELWTGRFAHAPRPAERDKALAEIKRGIEVAHGMNLEVHAGHGLTYRNVHELATIPGLSEFNIGHSIVSRAMYVGMREAVREMKRLVSHT